jgi:mannitol 2-dehydrogenase
VIDGKSAALAIVTSLRTSTLPQWRGTAVRIPEYDRARAVPGIVHIGVGGFHRAHLAAYIDRSMASGGASDWAICGVGLLAADSAMRDALQPQEGLYTLLERDAAGERAAIIGSLVKYLFAPGDPETVIAQLASAGTHIASLTITESGYSLGHDARNGAFGFLAAALRRRHDDGLDPFTVLSCDNVHANGDLTREVLLQFVERHDPSLGPWLASRGAFPNSMVDRITPRTTEADRRHVADAYGIGDAWPVVCESFMQWVVEDRFCDGRPEWERVGVHMAADVAPYELMKLRLLNAGHSALGYLGYLAGYRTVHEVMADAAFVEYLRVFMIEEVKPLLPPVPGIDLDAYVETLLQRFANPAIGDQLARLCMDGSGKMPRFVLPSIRERLARGGPRRMLVLCLAAWLRYLQGVDDQGERYEIADPLGARLQMAARTGGMDPRPVLAVESIFGEDLVHSRELLAELEAALQSLHRRGVREALRQP